ncbi:glycoside hydrolase 5 family protein [Xanthobacter pseudotagetidis]|uniref:glycosyl hydrolase n=1 Tax=Xanthobacter pseudotagetidis TaxID=3119911 RepID=UPI00372B3BCD
MHSSRLCFAALPLLAALATAPAAASQVSVQGRDILVDGRPFLPRGASGTVRLADLKGVGANVIRTYGEDPGETLDAAQRIGLKVIVGFWMGHPRLGFDYANRAAVDDQLAALRRMVERYRSHPALLMWGIGNEVEVEADPESTLAAFAAVGEAARLAKTLDGQHPTLAVVAELGGTKIADLKRLAPAIDVLGINSYGDGAMSAPARARAEGWSGPLLLTEMGALGHWQAPSTPWGARFEPTSTQKADRLRRYLAATEHAAAGALPFLWGQKQEVTPTWYSLLTPSGEWTESVEAMAGAWGGKVPGGAGNRAPRILSFRLAGADSAPAGTDFRTLLAATDPDGDPLKVEWQVMAETTARSVGGDPEAAPPSFPEALMDGTPTGARIHGLPAGRYRVFAYVRDGRGAAATANLPFEIRQGP